MNPDVTGWAKILIVADESAHPSLLEGLLRNAGYVNIRSTTHLQATLTLVAEFQPDLLCFDLQVLHREGAQAIEDGRQQRPARLYLPILVVLGEATPEARRRTLTAGANDCLTQPVDRFEFLLRARNLLEPRRLHRMLETERASIDRLQNAALAAAADAILITDRDGTIQWVNRAFSALTGYAADEAVGQRPGLLRSGRHPPEFYEHLWRTIRSGAVWRGEVVNRYKDGRLATEAMTITPVRGDDGTITHFIAIKQDVTAANAAAQAQRRLAAIVEATPNFVATADPQGHILYLNRAARRLLELPDDLEPSAITIASTHPPWAADLVLREGVPAAVRHGLWRGETALLSRSGRVIPVSQIALAHRAPDGQLEFLSTIAHDISERKQAEQALADALAFHAALVTAAPIGIATYHVTGPCVSANPAAAEMVGATAADLQRQNFRTLESWKASGLLGLADRAISTRQSQAADLHIRTTFGRDIWVRARCAAFRAGEDEHLLVMLTDITERKEAEKALRESEAQFSGAFEHAATGMALTALDGRWLRVNRALCAILGYSAGELLAKRFQDLTHPDDLESSLDFVRQLLAGEFDSYQMMERRYVHKAGQIVWVLLSVSLVRDDTGAPRHFIAQMQDITERKRIEDDMRRQHALAAQNEKLAAMSTLLAGVAHELNNPLAVVVGRAALLRARVRDEALARQTGQLEEAAVRCARIVKNFLAVAREYPPERQYCSLNTIIRDSVDILAYPLRVDGVELHLALAEDLPEVHADGHQLGQVVINLVSNAHHAVRGAETRRITVTTHHEAARGVVSLAVEDTGPGIPPDIERRIFEPFFTTKPVGQGTGLGLPLCRGIVEEHGGTLVVDGGLGRGARFVVELPLQLAPEPASARESPGASLPLPPGHILVVDDEPDVASLVAEVLTEDGHTVETVTSARTAVECLTARPYDVIVSDIRMPELDGIALYEVLGQQQPAACARLIFLTGDTLDPVLGEFLRNSGRPYVAKPFTPEQLRRAMAQVLPPGPAGASAGQDAPPPPAC